MAEGILVNQNFVASNPKKGMVWKVRNAVEAIYVFGSCLLDWRMRSVQIPTPTSPYMLSPPSQRSPGAFEGVLKHGYPYEGQEVIVPA